MNKIQIQADLAGVLRRARNQNFPLQPALLELIDNSVDAGADSIILHEDSAGNLVIEDTGSGFDDIASALIVGKSSKTGSIGRYGVGLKDATVKYSESTTISSRGVVVRAPWDEIAQGVHTGEITPEKAVNDGKTKIVLEGFRNRYSAAIQTTDIRRAYSPLLSGGAISIAVNGEQLQPLELPEFTEKLEASLEFRGRTVRIDGGIFAPSDPMRRMWAGYNPFYRGRLIGNGRITNVGVGDEACTAFCFLLHLEDGETPWVLATNKDAVTDLNELLEFCYDTQTRELLKKGAVATQEIELREMEESITGELSSNGNITRGNPTGRRGTVNPTLTGPPKKQTESADSEGRYSYNGGGRRRRDPIRFKFGRLGGDTLGEVQDHGKQLIITANLDNAFVNEHRTNEPVILAIAKLIYSMRRVLKSQDLMHDNLVTTVMDEAGKELP